MLSLVYNVTVRCEENRKWQNSHLELKECPISSGPRQGGARSNNESRIITTRYKEFWDNNEIREWKSKYFQISSFSGSSWAPETCFFKFGICFCSPNCKLGFTHKEMEPYPNHLIFHLIHIRTTYSFLRFVICDMITSVHSSALA